MAGFPTVIANAQRLLDAARRNGLRIFHAAYKRDFSRAPPRPFEPVATDGGPSFSDITNPATEICSEVAPSPGETVIVKNDASAFCEGDLLPALRQAEIEWLTVAGVWSEACVAASVRDAIAAGFRVLLIKDACGSGTEAMHEDGDPQSRQPALWRSRRRYRACLLADEGRECRGVGGGAPSANPV